MHSFPGGSVIDDHRHSHANLESFCSNRFARVVEDFDCTPFGNRFPCPRRFSCFLGIFGPFFGDATSIIFTCHGCHELFRAHYDRHDIPSILQSKIRCSEMSAWDGEIKWMSKNAVFALCSCLSSEINI